MTNQIHRTLIIMAEYREAALDLIAAAAGEDQRGMLSVPVGVQDDEKETVTHYMSTGNILETFADLLPLDEWDGEQYVRAKEPDYDAIVAASGASLEQLVPIMSAATVTTEDWRTTLVNIGLEIC